jgi:hypothetical protein
MTVSFPFQQQHTWRKLGYLYFSDSLSYREVLEENPQWKVTELPPLGAQIRLTSTPTRQTPGGLSQGDFLFGLPTVEQAASIYPYETEELYDISLNKYTLQGVLDREELNGITFDSVQAITGQQNG